jgi:hypothetical protein
MFFVRIQTLNNIGISGRYYGFFSLSLAKKLEYSSHCLGQAAVISYKHWTRLEGLARDKHFIS